MFGDYLRPIIIMLLMCQATICFATLKSTVNRVGDAFSLYFLIFGLVYILRPAFIVMEMDSPFPENLFIFPIDEAVINAILISTFWAIFFWIGAKLPISVLPNFVLPKFHQNIPLGAYKIAVVSLGSISLIILLILASKYGTDIYAITRAVRIERIFGGFTIIQHIPAICGYLLATYSFTLNGVNGKGRRLAFYLGPISIFICSITLLFGGRASFFYFMVFYILGYNLYIRKLSFTLLSMIGALTLTILYLLKKAREDLWYSDTEWHQYSNNQSETIARNLSDSANLDSFDKLILLIQHNVPISYGDGFLNSFLAIVPKIFWPDKPANLYMDIEFHNYFEYAVTGWPLKSLGEWYWNFGFIGIFYGAILSGAIFSTIQRRYRGFENNPSSYLFMYILAVEVFQCGYYGVSPLYYIFKIIPLVIIILGSIAAYKFIARPSGIPRLN